MFWEYCPNRNFPDNQNETYKYKTIAEKWSGIHFGMIYDDTHPPCVALEIDSVNIELVYPSQLHESV